MYDLPNLGLTLSIKKNVASDENFSLTKTNLYKYILIKFLLLNKNFGAKTYFFNPAAEDIIDS